MAKMKRYKLKINSSEKLEELLQELYDEACWNIEVVQKELNRYVNSTNLNEETSDSKAKIGKITNDFVSNMDKALGRKLEIAKLMHEILKYHGNAKKAIEESENVGDWSNILEDINKMDTGEEMEEVKSFKISLRSNG